MPSPSQQTPASFTGGDCSLNLLKLREPARYGDSTGMLIPILLLRFSQQLPKQRVVKVHHRHKHPTELIIAVAVTGFMTHVHRQMTLRHHRLFFNRAVTTQL